MKIVNFCVNKTGSRECHSFLYGLFISRGNQTYPSPKLCYHNFKMIHKLSPCLHSTLEWFVNAGPEPPQRFRFNYLFTQLQHVSHLRCLSASPYASFRGLKQPFTRLMHTATEWPKFAWKFLLSLFAHNPADTNFVRSSQFNRSFHQPTNYSSLRLNSSAAQISSRRVTLFRSFNFIIISCFLIVTGACSTNTFSTIREKLSPDLSWIY